MGLLDTLAKLLLPTNNGKYVKRHKYFSNLKLLFCYPQSLSFQTIQHVVTTVDAQLTVDGGLIVFVVGQLKVGCSMCGFLSFCMIIIIPLSYFLTVDFHLLGYCGNKHGIIIIPIFPGSLELPPPSLQDSLGTSHIFTSSFFLLL